MDKNEYRRSLIMLRSLANGYTGHARLEIRTLTGVLNIVAAIPQGAQNVRAALVGNRRGEYFATPLGVLRRDLRGQAGLSITFDPRRIGGRTLDAYSLLILVNTDDGACALVLAGNLAGSCELDWSKVRDAVCALYLPETDDLMTLPTPIEPRETAPNVARDEPSVEPERSEEPEPDISPEEAPAPPESCAPDETPADIAGETPESSDEINLIDSDAAENGAENAQEQENEMLMWEFPAEDAENPPEDSDDDDERPAQETPFTRSGWKFTRVALPSGCGFSHSYVGVPDASDTPAEICCALPGSYSPEPPPGLDDYEWSGGTGEGWWIKCYIAR
jgi:hypothetical protein